MKVLNNIAKAITKNYPGKKININDITQGFETPSFTLQLVNHRDTTIAGIKFILLMLFIMERRTKIYSK